MHSVTESAYEAANEWLKSFGEECETDSDHDRSTEPPSPSQVHVAGRNSMSIPRGGMSMHASMFPLYNFNLPVASDIAKRSKGPKPASNAVDGASGTICYSDKRMKGDVCVYSASVSFTSP